MFERGIVFGRTNVSSVGKLFKSVTVGVVACATLAFAAPAYASVATIDFLQNACSGATECDGSNSIIAQATLTEVANDVSVAIKILDSSFAFIQAGNPPMVTFQAAASGFSGTSSDMDNLFGGSTWGLDVDYQGANEGNAGAAGTFNHWVGFLDKVTKPFTIDIVFLLSNVSIADFAANANGFNMGIDMCKLNTGTSASCAATGYVGGKLSAVPLPAGLPLLGGGVALLGALGLRRKRKTAASA